MIAAAAPSNARAADYRVWACANGSSSRLGPGDWQASLTSPFSAASNTCASATGTVGSFHAEGRANPNVSGWTRTGGGWVVVAAPGTRIKDLDVWWTWTTNWPSRATSAIWVGALGNTYIGTGTLNPLHPGCLVPPGGVGGCPNSLYVANKGAFGNPATPFAEVNHQAFHDLVPATTMVWVHAMCILMCAQPQNETVASFETYRVATSVEDSTAPHGGSSGLRSGMRVGAGTPVQSNATDIGGGVHDISLRVDGRIVQRVGGGATCSDVDPSNDTPYEYNVMKPCPSTLEAPLTLSADHMPDNEGHTVTAVATDAAGQDTVLSSARAALAAPDRFYDSKNGFYNPDLDITGGRNANGSNAESSAKLTLGFARGHRTSRRQIARYSARPRIRGRVRTGGKKPVVGARVWRAERVQGGEWRISGKPLITSRSGRVSARLPARNPNRTVRLLYFPYTDTNANAGSANRGLRVKATTTIQTDQGGYRNGDAAKFSGRVIRKRLIKNKSVYLQAIVRGKWRTFATTRADSKGRWAARHRFEATRRPTVYTFRAVVPSGERGWPWATGYSRRLRVIVTP